METEMETETETGMETEMEMEEEEPKGCNIQRLEVFFMWFDTANAKDIQRFYRIYIGDGARVCESFNPPKVDSLYTDLPEPMQCLHNFESPPKRRSLNYSFRHNYFYDFERPRKRRGLNYVFGRNSNTGWPLLTGKDEGEITGLPPPLTGKDEGEIQVSCSYRWSHNQHRLIRWHSKRRYWDAMSDHTYLQLTGPKGEIIVPNDFFDVIVHRCTDLKVDDSHSPTVHDSHLKAATPSYLLGLRSETEFDVVENWTLFDPRFFDKLTRFQLHGDFGALNVRFVVFSDSKLVTVDVKWFSIIGEDGEKNNATTETYYICGSLSVYSNKYNVASVLLETPEDKAIKVSHGESIPMLRYVVALPYFSHFTVEAALRDPINKSVVEGSAFFEFNHFYGGDVKNYYTEEKSVDGCGAKITVEVKVEL